MSIINPQGIMPDNLMRKEARAEAIKWLIFSPYNGSMKVGMLRGWANIVGLTLTFEEYQKVAYSGVKTTPVDVPKTEGR